MQDTPHREQATGRGWWLPFALGVTAGCGVIFVLLAGVTLTLGLLFYVRGGEEIGATPPGEMPRATLRVADDECGVIRSDFGGEPPEGLQWVVTDEDGFQVLGRAAESETRYRYYVAGRYEVVLQAHNGEKYVDVSNRVRIECP
jgi:hypothetical protein